MQRTQRRKNEKGGLSISDGVVDATQPASASATQPKSKSAVMQRVISGFVMVVGFVFLVWLGHLSCAILTTIIQIMCFREIMQLGKPDSDERQIPLFRTIQYAFLFCSMLYLYGEGVMSVVCDVTSHEDLFYQFVRFQNIIYISIYFSIFMLFVWSMKKGCYADQVKYFARTHATIVAVVFTVYLGVKDLFFGGLIWYLLPALIVVVNDIAAYVCGKNFGKTPLIQLSPKKTWEGYIGGLLFTVLFAVFGGWFMMKFDFFVCPKTDFRTSLVSVTPGCERSSEFVLQDIALFWGAISVKTYPFFIHSFVLGVFGSIVAPFGGFFASGLKRAFRVKDFGSVIPGHGGWTDRFDCQFVMHPFVYVYRISFVASAVVVSVSAVMNKISQMTIEDQKQVLELLGDNLKGL